MNIQVTSREIHENAVEKGFWPQHQNIGEKLMLIVSELGEAMEAHREGKFCDNVSMEKVSEALSNAYSYPDLEMAQIQFVQLFEDKVKDTFGDELADTVIRILDLAYAMGINMEKHIWLKNSYNKTREHLHGKNY